ncbi:hypothetical protein D3C87_1437310 [compost metagenome]
MFAIVAIDKSHLAVVIGEGQFLAPLAATLPPVFGPGRPAALQQCEVMDVGHCRALYFHRIILFGLGTEVGQVVGGKIDPANERNRAIYDHYLAVQATEPVGTNAEVLGSGIEYLDTHAGLAQRREKGGAQFAAAKTVETGGDPHAAFGGIDQHLLQFIAHLVLEHDEGFQQDLTLGRAHDLEHSREIRFAVFQQLHQIVALPAVLDVDRARCMDRRGRG